MSSNPRTKGKNNPETTRERNARYARESGKTAHKHFQLWSQEDDASILADDRPGDTTLAKQIGRTIHAIQDRRYELLRGSVPTGGLNGHPRKKPAKPVPVIPEDKKPSLAIVRLRALNMGLRPPEEASLEAIQEWIRVYAPFHRDGVVVGLHVELNGFGPCRVGVIHPGSSKATVTVLKTGGKRFIPLNDIKRALNLGRVAARRRER